MDDKTPKAEGPTEIDIYYQKAQDHRTLSCDGSWAGLTPQMNIQVAFFTELQPMPIRTRHKVVHGALGQEVLRDVQAGIIRETAVTVVLEPLVAIQVVQLLTEMIRKLR